MPKSSPPQAAPRHCFTSPNLGQSVWNILEGEDLLFLNRAQTCHVYQPDQHVFYQGNPCLGLYYIKSGCVMIHKLDRSGNDVKLRLTGPNETLGYRSYFSGGAYCAAAVALKESQVCFLERAVVEEILQRNPVLGVRFAQKLARDLGRAEASFLESCFMSVRSRVAGLLLLLKEHFGVMEEDGTWHLDIPFLSRQDLASMVGVRMETVIRTLSELEKEKVLLVQYRRITIPDLDLLLDEVEHDGA